MARIFRILCFVMVSQSLLADLPTVDCQRSLSQLEAPSAATTEEVHPARPVEPPISPEQFKLEVNAIPLRAEVKAQWEALTRGIFDRVFPEHDWKKKPIEFLLIDEPEVNAFYANLDDKHYIGLTKGLLTRAKSEDVIAWVIGHEYNHLRLRVDLGPGENSLTEEALSDTMPLKALEKAGFDTTACKEFFQVQRRVSFTERLLQIITDPHPLDHYRASLIESRIGILAEELGGLNRDRGYLRKPNKAFKEFVKHLHAPPKSRQRQNAFTHPQPDLLEQMPEPIFITWSESLKYLKTSLQALKTKQERFITQQWLRDLATHLSGSRGYVPNQNEKKLIQPVLHELYRYLWQNVDELYASEPRRVRSEPNPVPDSVPSLGDFFHLYPEEFPEPPPLREFRYLSDQFAQAEQTSSALVAARELNRWVTQNKSPLSRLNGLETFQLRSDLFQLPASPYAYRRNEMQGKRVPWDRFISMAREDKTGQIRQTLLSFGISDSRLFEQMSLKEIQREIHRPFYLGEPNVIDSADRDTEGQRVRFTFDEEGKISRSELVPHKLGGQWIEFIEVNTDRILALADRLFGQVVRHGRVDLEEQLIAIAREVYQTTDGLPLPVIGLRYVLEAPELFRKVNHLGFASASGKYFETEEGVFLDNEMALLSQLETFSEDPKMRDGVRQYFLTYANDLHLEGLDSDLNEFLLRDVNRLFRPEEKVAIINAAGSYSLKETKFSPYQTKLWRDALTIPEATSLTDLENQILQIQTRYATKTGDSSDVELPQSKKRDFTLLIQGALVFDYITRHPDETTTVVNRLWPHLPSRLLKFQPEINRLVREELDLSIFQGRAARVAPAALRLLKAKVFATDPARELSLAKVVLEANSQTKSAELKQKRAQSIIHSPAMDWPEVRDAVTRQWADATLARYRGEPEPERNRAILHDLDELTKELDGRTRYDFIRDFAELSTSQRTLADELKVRATGVQRKQLEDSRLVTSTLQATLELSRNDYELRDAFLDYLSTKETGRALTNLENNLTRAIRRTGLAGDFSKFKPEQSEWKNWYEKASSPHRQAVLEKMRVNFKSSPLAAQALIIKEFLLPYHSNSSMREQVFAGGLDFVLTRLFPPGEPYADEAKLLLTRYVRILSEEEKPLVLAAVIAAIDQGHREGAQSVGHRLARVLQLRGPAYIKTGQAIHSYQDTPPAIRDGMLMTKQDVDAPARWDLLSLYENTVPKTIRDTIDSVEERLGAASYYYVYRVKMKDGRELALALLKENAQARSEYGFSQLLALLEEIKRDSQKKFDPLALEEILKQARDMASIETNSAMARRQAKLAEKLYRDRVVAVGDEEFSFNPASSLLIGEGYRLMELAPGLTYNQLPENTAEAKAFKKRLGMAYLTLELTNLLSGEPFDEDRHGAQMKIQGNSSVLYDFGAMRPTRPKTQDLKILGRLLHAASTQLGQSSAGDILTQVFTDQLKRERESGKDTRYLAGLHKAWLALTDFRRDFTTEDYVAVFQAVLSSGKVNPAVLKGFESAAKESMTKAPESSVNVSHEPSMVIEVRK